MGRLDGRVRLTLAMGLGLECSREVIDYLRISYTLRALHNIERFRFHNC